MLAERFAPALDSHNRAPSGRRFAVPVYVQRNGDPSVTVAKLAVEVSYNDGGTWVPARLSGSGERRTAIVAHPASAGFVSLRATATDTDGNGVEQTIIRAYALKR